jgi:hypothetical protein
MLSEVDEVIRTSADQGHSRVVPMPEPSSPPAAYQPPLMPTKNRRRQAFVLVTMALILTLVALFVVVILYTGNPKHQHFPGWVANTIEIAGWAVVGLAMLVGCINWLSKGRPRDERWKYR